MSIDRQYVDSHGQSEVAFAFCHLLGFQLLPRLKAIHLQRLYRPESGRPEAYEHLQPVLTRPFLPPSMRSERRRSCRQTLAAESTLRTW